MYVRLLQESIGNGRQLDCQGEKSQAEVLKDDGLDSSRTGEFLQETRPFRGRTIPPHEEACGELQEAKMQPHSRVSFMVTS